jgi:hypothetical protein
MNGLAAPENDYDCAPAMALDLHEVSGETTSTGIAKSPRRQLAFYHVGTYSTLLN